MTPACQLYIWSWNQDQWGVDHGPFDNWEDVCAFMATMPRVEGVRYRIE